MVGGITGYWGMGRGGYTQRGREGGEVDSQESKVVILLSAAAGVSEILATFVLDISIIICAAFCLTRLIPTGCRGQMSRHPY